MLLAFVGKYVIFVAMDGRIIIIIIDGRPNIIKILRFPTKETILSL